MIAHLTASRLLATLALTTALGTATLSSLQAQAPKPAATATPPAPPAEVQNEHPGERGPHLQDKETGLDRVLGLGPDMHRGPMHKLSPEDRAAFLDAHMAAVKTALRLTPDQDKLWANLEAAVRSTAAKSEDERKAFAQKGRPTDPIERLARMAEATKLHSENLATLVEAARPLYASLNEDQKRRLGIMLRQPPKEGWGQRMGDRMRGWRDWGRDQMEGPHGRDRRGEDHRGDLGPHVGPQMGALQPQGADLFQRTRDAFSTPQPSL